MKEKKGEMKKMENAVSQSVGVEEEEVKLEVLNLGQRIFGEFKETKPSSLRKAKVVKIGGDSGKSYTKVSMIVRENGVDVVRSTSIYTSITRNEDKAVMDSAEEFRINKVRCLIGDPSRSLNSPDRRNQSKVLPLHRDCMIAAIAKLLYETGYSEVETVQLTVNLTLNDFSNISEQKKIRRLYEGMRTVEVEYRERVYKFKLKVLPYYEGLGALLNDYEFYADKEVVSIDFGSRNIGYATFNGLKVVEGFSGTLPYGTNQLLTQVQHILNNNKIMTINNDEQIISIIKGENKDIPAPVLELIKNKVQHFLDGIYSELFDCRVNVDYAEVILSGGGLGLFESCAHKVFKQAFENEKLRLIENPQYANSTGSIKLFM